ncbi:Processing of GAS1 and ALP protein 2 [Spathaspora sp. JA1]|nr:Processing of GAS1 and ALP protein 2 [Spathaspora sp. JA1]
MFEEIFEFVDQETFKKYFRLTIVVCAYLIFRKYYSQWAGKKQTERQMAEDAKEKAEKPEREEREKEERAKQLEAESKQFGWGKKTRRSVKTTEAALEEIIQEQRQRNQTSYDAQEDADIEDLLED